MQAARYTCANPAEKRLKSEPAGEMVYERLILCHLLFVADVRLSPVFGEF